MRIYAKHHYLIASQSENQVSKGKPLDQKVKHLAGRMRIYWEAKKGRIPKDKVKDLNQTLEKMGLCLIRTSDKKFYVARKPVPSKKAVHKPSCPRNKASKVKPNSQQTLREKEVRELERALEASKEQAKAEEALVKTEARALAEAMAASLEDVPVEEVKPQSPKRKPLPSLPRRPAPRAKVSKKGPSFWEKIKGFLKGLKSGKKGSSPLRGFAETYRKYPWLSGILTVITFPFYPLAVLAKSLIDSRN